MNDFHKQKRRLRRFHFYRIKNQLREKIRHHHDNTIGKTERDIGRLFNSHRSELTQLFRDYEFLKFKSRRQYNRLAELGIFDFVNPKDHYVWSPYGEYKLIDWEQDDEDYDDYDPIWDDEPDDLWLESDWKKARCDQEEADWENARLSEIDESDFGYSCINGFIENASPPDLLSYL